jgi:hypothetical protein
MKKTTTIMALLICIIAVSVTQGSTLAQTPAKPNINLNPSTYTANAVGKTFTLEVWVNNSVGLYGYGVKIHFDPGILVASGWQSGGFLESSMIGATYAPANHSEIGWFGLATALNEPGSVSGNGTLAKFNFTVLNGGRCALDLYDTELLNESSVNMEHTATDGLFVLNYISLTPSTGIAAFALQGFGFGQNSVITSITWNGTKLPLPSITTDGRGNFITITVAPDISTPGNYTIHVEDSPGNHQEAVFTLIQATGTPGPQGPIGPQGPAGAGGQMEYVWGSIVLSIIAMIIAIYALSKKS